MYDSSAIFSISPRVHPLNPLYIWQWIDCKYLFVRAHRREEAWHLLVLWHVALLAFFPAWRLVLWDWLLREWQAFLPFLERLLIIPFFCSFLNVWRTLSIYYVYRSSLSPAALGGFPENLLRLYRTNHLFYLISPFYSSA